MVVVVVGAVAVIAVVERLLRVFVCERLWCFYSAVDATVDKDIY